MNDGQTQPNMTADSGNNRPAATQPLSAAVPLKGSDRNRILFFGNERIATGVTTNVSVLQTLLAAGYELTGVVTAQQAAGPSRKPRELEIVQVAEAHHIPVFSPDKLADARDQLAALGADIGVLVAYGKIVPQSIIDVFPCGIINLHPSLLPKHRGPTPIESVLLAGETQTGVSLMQLAAGLDSGPVYAQVPLDLEGYETKQALADELLLLGKDMLLQLLPPILKGDVQPTAQDESQATADLRLDKAASTIDWQKTAVQLEREIRAFAGWPRSRTTLGRSEVIITAARIAQGSGTPGQLWIEDRQIGVFTGEGVLVIDKLIPAGKNEMDAAAFMTGYFQGL